MANYSATWHGDEPVKVQGIGDFAAHETIKDLSEEQKNALIGTGMTEPEAHEMGWFEVEEQ